MGAEWRRALERGEIQLRQRSVPLYGAVGLRAERTARADVRTDAPGASRPPAPRPPARSAAPAAAPTGADTGDAARGAAGHASARADGTPHRRDSLRDWFGAS